MERIEVSNSSNIEFFEYEQGTLTVGFLNGSIYEYYDVPEHIFEGMKHADSYGKYLAQNVKGVYRYSRV